MLTKQTRYVTLVQGEFTEGQNWMGFEEKYHVLLKPRSHNSDGH